MAQTAGSVNKKNSNKSPEVTYERQEYINKLICYNFYIHLKTDSASGWNSDPDKKPVPASVEHYRSSQFIFSSLSENQFKHRAKVYHFHLILFYNCVYLVLTFNSCGSNIQFLLLVSPLLLVYVTTCNYTREARLHYRTSHH